jgi:DNA processing protein
MLPAMDAIDAWLALARAPGVHADQLREHHGWQSAPEELLGQGAHQLRLMGLPPAAAQWLADPDQRLIESDREWLARDQVQLICHGAADYPPLLTDTANAPLVLYVRGAAARLLSAQLAMVGSRRPTPAGRRIAFEFAASLARAGLTITSGLALGIDRASHEGALSTGCTLAVMGTGLDTVYPPENRALAERIVTGGGALLGEFPPGTPAHAANFPRRNRLISGLSLGTLVIEAAQRSGSLITARLAGEQGREVFAVPGAITNPVARGCHALIRQGARLVEEPAEVLAELNIPYSNQAVTNLVGPVASTPVLDNDHKILLDALGFEPTSLDSLVERTGLSSQSLASMLLMLELEGRVGLHPGGRYLRLA